MHLMNEHHLTLPCCLTCLTSLGGHGPAKLGRLPAGSSDNSLCACAGQCMSSHHRQVKYPKLALQSTSVHDTYVEMHIPSLVHYYLLAITGDEVA
jgi:hypothetical protein